MLSGKFTSVVFFVFSLFVCSWCKYDIESGCNFMTSCDVLNAIRSEMGRATSTDEVRAINAKLGDLTQFQMEVKNNEHRVAVWMEEMEFFMAEVKEFMRRNGEKGGKRDGLTSPENLMLGTPDSVHSDEATSKLESRLDQIETKLADLESNGNTKSLQQQVQDLQRELLMEKQKQRFIDIKLNSIQQQLADSKETLQSQIQQQNLKIERLQENLNITQDHTETHEQHLGVLQVEHRSLSSRLNSTIKVTERELEEIVARVNEFGSQIYTELYEYQAQVSNITSEHTESIELLNNLMVNQTEKIREVLQEGFTNGHYLNGTIQFLMDIINQTESSLTELVTNHTAMLHQELQDVVEISERSLKETVKALLSKINQKANAEDMETMANITNKAYEIANGLTLDFQVITYRFEELENYWKLIENEVEHQSDDARILKSSIDKLSKQVSADAFANKLTRNKVEDLEAIQTEVSEKLGEVQQMLEEIRQQLSADVVQVSEEEDDTFHFVGSQSEGDQDACLYQRSSNDVIAYLDGRPIRNGVESVPHGDMITFRCRDVGAFKLSGDPVMVCINGSWTSLHPICQPLATAEAIEANTVPTNATPSILIIPQPDSDSTGVQPNGTVIVSPGSKVTLACIFPSSMQRVEWSTDNQRISTQWNEDNKRLEVHIGVAREYNSRSYTCSNPLGGNHTINLEVKNIKCPEPPYRKLMRFTGKFENKMNTIAHLQCTELGYHVAWPESKSESNKATTISNAPSNKATIKCLPSGQWSREWPQCVPRSGRA